MDNGNVSIAQSVITFTLKDSISGNLRLPTRIIGQDTLSRSTYFIRGKRLNIMLCM